MATVMAWLHFREPRIWLQTCCVATGTATADPELQQWGKKGVNTHFHIHAVFVIAFALRVIYFFNQKCSLHKQPGPLLPATFSVPRIRMERRTCMWRMQVGGSDVSRIWQDRSGTASSQRAASQKHMQGTCASHFIHRHGLICPCWDQSTAAKAWG